MVDFVPTVVEGEPQCLEHSTLSWVSLHDLQGLDLAPSDRRFVEVTLNRAAKTR